MKYFALLLLLCVCFVFAGCNEKSAADVPVINGNGTLAIGEFGGSASAQDDGAASSDSDARLSGDAVPAVTDPASDAGDTNDAGVLEIKEKLFIAQTNDIYYNTEDYLGKTIKYEGIFTSYEVPETGEKYCSVIRFGPGCCGYDGNAGFEVVWDKEYPQENDWVEVIGVLEKYGEGGAQYLRLALSSLKVLPVRGAEFVSQ